MRQGCEVRFSVLRSLVLLSYRNCSENGLRSSFCHFVSCSAMLFFLQKPVYPLIPYNTAIAFAAPSSYTLGARGMVLVGDGEPYFVKSLAREVFDVSGAGDTTISYLAACMVNGMTIRDAVDIANYAAGIQVGKVGTSSVRWQEVRDLMSNEDHGYLHKILTAEDVTRFREDNKDKKIVFTNGCFDILHVGHKRYLQQAATLGDLLIVGVNSDDSVRRLKGPDRPVNTEQDRAEMLSALGFIDYVVIFEEDTPYELIKKIQPDVLVKGGDYKPEEVVGRDIVEARGGRLELIQFVDGKSTTRIIEKIKK